MAPDSSITVPVRILDDRGDAHRVAAESDDVDVATVVVSSSADGTLTLVIDAIGEGMATLTVHAFDRDGVRAVPVAFDAVVVSPALAALVVGTGGRPGELDVTFIATLDPGETRAFDYQLRRQHPQTPWQTVCLRWTNNRSSEVTANARRTFSGLAAGARFEVRYRDRGASSCAGGSPGRWSAVGEGTARAESRAMALDAANGDPAGITYANGRLYVLDDVDDKVYAYTVSGKRDADSDLDLGGHVRQPEGITSVDDKLFVADDGDGRVYAYDIEGSRDEESDFDLHASNGTPWGIAYANGRFHVVDGADDKVYVYLRTGERDADSEFDLDPDNRVPGGITYAEGRLYVVEWAEDKVYAYDGSGEREASLDFELDEQNTSPEGIVHADGRFFVADDSADRIFVYADGGGSDSPLTFFDAPTARREVPENAPSGINVGAPEEATGGEALTYTLGGNDAASFDIVTETGQIRTVDGVYDYEAKDRYEVEVEVVDGAGNRETINVVIHVVDLLPSCGLGSDLDARTSTEDKRLMVRWKALRDTDGHAPVQGYDTEIRVGDSGPWIDRRTFIGRTVTGTVYADLENETEYQVRVRSINSEDECDWSTPVSGTPTDNLAPKDGREHRDRFGPHLVGSPDRGYRLLTPGRCLHTLGGTRLHADCTYERTAPDAGRIVLELDDPSKGSCDVRLAYSSLTAGSFIDECFSAGVNTNVPFDRTFRMPESIGGDAGEVVRIPRTPEEFDVFAWGREDLIPGLGFGCPPPVQGCQLNSGNGYTIGRDPDTGRTLWKLGDYSYESTGPSSGVVSFRTDTGERFEITLRFQPSGSVQATITAVGGEASDWPGMPHLDLTLGAQSILMPIPPSWSSAIAIALDNAPADMLGLELLVPETSSCASDPWSPPMCILLGDLWHRSIIGPVIITASGNVRVPLIASIDYSRIGRNRGTFSVRWELAAGFSARNLTDLQKQLLGSTWVFDLTFTLRGVAQSVLTITKDGHLPTIVERLVDFAGDGASFDEFPDELLLPEEPPQAAGQDVSGIEVAAALSVSSIGSNDLQAFLVSASGAAYEPGDWFEAKDGANQRMMIVATGQASAAVAVSESMLPSRVKTRVDTSPYTLSVVPFQPATRKRSAPTSGFIQLTVVCMQSDRNIPTRGSRYFSKAKVPEGSVQSCQKECVIEGGIAIQGCVWGCERAQAVEDDGYRGATDNNTAVSDPFTTEGDFEAGGTLRFLEDWEYSVHVH